jgi:hypothetical protein
MQKGHDWSQYPRCKFGKLKKISLKTEAQIRFGFPIQLKPEKLFQDIRPK